MNDDKNASFGLPETPEQVIARLTAALAATQAELAAAKAPAEVEPVKDLDSQGFEKEYVHLHIFEGQRPDDIKRVPLGIGGYVVEVERGKKVIIHKAFAAILEDAIEHVTVSGVNELITRPAHRFPFRIEGPATEAEYLAFKAQMKSGPSAAVVRG
jgi:hypothetical protein